MILSICAPSAAESDGVSFSFHCPVIGKADVVGIFGTVDAGHIVYGKRHIPFVVVFPVSGVIRRTPVPRLAVCEDFEHIVLVASVKKEGQAQPEIR